jgi:hypothetical protein
MFATIPKAIYDKVYTLLADNSLSYFKTKQRGFIPVNENLLHPSQYPWIFIEFGGLTPPEPYRLPYVFTYEFTVNVVAMTLADKAGFEDLVYNINNTNKGIGDITADLGALFWAYKKNFDVDGIIDWSIGRVGPPNVSLVQPLLINPYVRGIQFDLVFKCQERLSV